MHRTCENGVRAVVISYTCSHSHMVQVSLHIFLKEGPLMCLMFESMQVISCKNVVPYSNFCARDAVFF